MQALPAGALHIHPGRRLAAAGGTGGRRPAAKGGQIPLAVREQYNPAKHPAGPGAAVGRPKPALAPPVATFHVGNYGQARRRCSRLGRATEGSLQLLRHLA